jgi:deoxyxylulose-5-phosphate synthase
LLDIPNNIQASDIVSSTLNKYKNSYTKPKIGGKTIDAIYSILSNAKKPLVLCVGVAGQNAVGIAAGLVLSGFKPYIYNIALFALMRCFEQIRIDIAYMKTKAS